MEYSSGDSDEYLHEGLKKKAKTTKHHTRSISRK